MRKKTEERCRKSFEFFFHPQRKTKLMQMVKRMHHPCLFFLLFLIYLTGQIKIMLYIFCTYFLNIHRISLIGSDIA